MQQCTLHREVLDLKGPRRFHISKKPKLAWNFKIIILTSSVVVYKTIEHLPKWVKKYQ